jgi:hypothetical protein
MTLLRWVTRFLGLVIISLFGYAVAQGTFAIGATTDVRQDVLYGFVAVSILLAVFLPGMGELAGGLTLMGVLLWLLTVTGYSAGALLGAAPFALVGALFFVCGLSELYCEPRPMRHARHARHALA